MTRQKVERIQILRLDLDVGNMFLGFKGHLKLEMEV